ncbi:sensor histidine kinase [Cohnella lupini]|uniref:Two-component system sensor histidine kinase YesM n=1 Tax=Cohnella lupini TaxID=1294267 RepID=A0A3D9ITX9_9BACL|nr:histidine kinase [Cohnella lupini]RED64969.1 two-component system sensor histidine kinase YesM [Cohnella lupini]
MNIAKSFFNAIVRLYRKIRNQRLRSKLFLVYLLVSILPISFLVLYSYQTVKDQLIHQAVENIGSTIDQVNKNIENKLDMYSQVATLLYSDTQLRNYLINTYKAKDLSFLDAYDYINKTLYKMLAMNPNLKSITIYTENKTLFSDGLFIKHMEELPDALREQSLQAAGNITQFFPNNQSPGAKTVTLARSLNYLSLNYPYGILTMEISERELFSLIEKENNNKTIIVADENGHIITSGIKDGDIGNVADISDIGGKDTMVIQKSLKNGWKTVVLLPYAELLGQAQKATAKMLYISLACILAAIVMIYATSKFMTKRIEFLLQQIRKVERGSIALSFTHMGDDEIGQLSFALNKMSVTIQDLIQDVYKQELSKNEAEMTSLQAQITPHFLYNTLASISALAIKSNNSQVHRMADDLARFYRISLNKGKKCITIEKEIKLTEHYISIQKTRFQGLFNVHYVLDEDLFHYTTLKLVAQPFIENCINHAIWDDECGINIVIKLAADGNDVLLSVIDDGMGMPKDVFERMRNPIGQSEGYGIYNVDKRIRLAYGERYGVQVYSKLGIGTSVQIRIPMTTKFL